MSAWRRTVPAAALLLLAASAQAAPPAPPAKAKDASARVLAELTLPDLRGTLAHVEGVVAAFAPGTLPPGALMAMAGEKLKDPGLAALGSGPIVAMVMLPDAAAATPGVVVFIPVKDGKAYQDATAAMGFASSSSRGLVIAASDARTLALGRGLEPRYRRAVSAPAAAARDVSLSLNAPRLMELYGPLLKLGMASAVDKLKEAPAGAKPGSAPPEAFVSLMRMEMAGFVSLLEQLDELRVDLSLRPDLLDSETILVARPGTALAEVAQAPPPGPNRAAGIVSGPGTMAAVYRFDPARVTTFVVGLANTMASDPSLAGIITPQLLDLLREAGTLYTGEAAMRMDVRPGKMPPFVMEASVGVTDEARALAMADAAMTLALGWLDALPQGNEPFPLEIKLQKDVRRVGGVAVHRVHMSEKAKPAPAGGTKMTGKKPPKKSSDKKGLDKKGDPKAPEAKDPFKFDTLDTEFAFAHGYYLTAQEPAALDRLIERAGQPGSATPLQAEKSFGPGRQAYVDYDFLGLLKAMPALEAGKPDPFASLRGVATEPMLYAVRLERGTIHFETRVPLSAFKALAAAAEKEKAAGKETKDE